MEIVEIAAKRQSTPAITNPEIVQPFLLGRIRRHVRPIHVLPARRYDVHEIIVLHSMSLPQHDNAVTTTA
jgi:hypothetical protein